MLTSCFRSIVPSAKISAAVVVIALAAHPGAASEMPFPVEHLVSGTFDGASSVVSADIDGDGDIDIISVDDDPETGGTTVAQTETVIADSPEPADDSSGAGGGGGGGGGCFIKTLLE